MDGSHEIPLLIFLGQICIVLSIRNNIAIEMTEDMTEKCIVDILSSKTQLNSVLFIINNDAVSDDLLRQTQLLNNIQVCVNDYNASIKVVSDTYLIMYPQNHGNLKIFKNLIDNLDRNWYRQPEALFIIITKNIPENDLAAIFKILWQYHFIHVLVIANDKDEDALIYTYFPYAEGRCGRDYNNTVKLCDCKTAREMDVIEKLRENDKPVLNKCTVNVGAQDYPPLVICDPDPDNERAVGIERFLFELLMETEDVFLNYTCLPETEDVGVISDNMTVTGMLEKLYENQVDIMFGGYSVNYERGVFFDYICNHLANEDMYIPATSSADLIEKWKIVYITFHTNVWLLLLFTVFLCAILLSDFRLFWSFWIVKNIHDNMLEFFNLFGNATQNITLAPRERLFKNVVIIHWFWFIFLVNCFYQTGLTSFTTHRAHKPQLDLYHSLHDHNYTPCIPMGIVSFFKYSGKVPVINERYLEQDNCETAELALDKVANADNKYTVTMYLQYLWWTTRHSKENRRIHLMKETLYNNLYALFFKRGFPLLDKLNAKMLRLPEHGFVVVAKNFHHIPSNWKSEENRFDITALKLYDLTVPFVIFITGAVSSMLVFIIELVHGYNRITIVK